MRQGRPIRFLVLTLSGWMMARVVMLWPQTMMPDAAMASGIGPERYVAGKTVERPIATDPTSGAEASVTSRPSPAGSVELHPSTAGAGSVMRGSARPEQAAEPPTGTVPALASAAAPIASATIVAGPGGQASAEMGVVAPVGAATAAGASRLAGGIWFVARPGGGENLAFGQLGASQAGVRLTYALGEDRRLALSGRLSAPLRGRGREGAVGLDWRPTRLPVHLLVEGRLPLDGGGVRPAAQLIAGVAKPLPLGAQIEAYAQAGVVHRRGGFADGSARIVRPVLDVETARFDLGAGVWGAVQRGVSRVDLGPTLSVAVPVGGVAVRLGVDYRVRVAGKARPGSGPALTIGTSF